MWVIKHFIIRLISPPLKRKRKKKNNKQTKPGPGCQPEGAAVTSPSTRELYWHIAPLRLPSSGIPTSAFRETDKSQRPVYVFPQRARHVFSKVGGTEIPWALGMARCAPPPRLSRRPNPAGAARRCRRMAGEKPPFCLGNVQGKQPPSPSRGHAAPAARANSDPPEPRAAGQGATATSATSLPAAALPRWAAPARPRLHRPGAGHAVRPRAVLLPLDILVPGCPGLRPVPPHRSSRPRRSSRSRRDLRSRQPASSPAERRPRRHGPAAPGSPPLPPHVPARCPRSRSAPHLPESGPSPRRPARAADATHLFCCVSSGRAGSGRNPCSSG